MEIFLLGGCDLEMVVIKRLLQKYNKNFIDHNLKWGAKLSDYSDVDFSKYSKIYGIELTQDITPPKNYIEIDHHNQNYKKPSSLEQIAEILGHKLTFFEKLVAANDKGYIQEMQKLTSKISQIKIIRKLDRLAQGITKKDEELAKDSINKDYIIYSKTPYFSAVSDIAVLDLNLDRYIIYNDKKVVFYGYFYKDLIKKLNLPKDSYYYGGGEYGFFGIKEGVLNKDEILKILKGFRMYSYHIFMYPFVMLSDNNIEPNATIWQKKEFKIDTHLDYNEYSYFYPYVRKVLYSTDTNKKNSLIKHYETKENFKEYIIKTKNNEYRLKIEKINLIISGKIGVLRFYLKNDTYFNPSDILNINEYGRRIYPQYLSMNKEKFVLNDVKNSFLADEISIDNKLTENFSKYENKDNLNRYIKEGLLDELPDYISYFLKDLENIETIIDDRMFVVSGYKNDTLIKKLSEYNHNEYNYVNNEFWYEYLFIDKAGDLTCQNKNMRKKLLKKSTYARWIDYGTLFGISRYSFVLLAKNNDFSDNVLFNHMKTMYLEIFTLLLIYRAKIIYFSYEVQKIIENSQKENYKLKDLRKDTEKLYKKYLDFMNGLFFRELTPQEQGIEIYNQAIDIMQIEKYIKDLDGDISELHEYISMKEETARNSKLEKLNKLGTLFLPPALLAGIYGMNIADFYNDKLSFIFGIISIIISIRISELFLLDKEDRIFDIFLNKFITDKKDKIEKIEKIVWSIVVFLILYGLAK